MHLRLNPLNTGNPITGTFTNSEDPDEISVSRSLKKGQGATPKKGNFNARQPMSKGQPLDAATHVKKQKNMCQGQIKNFIINFIQFIVLIVYKLLFDRVCINISYCFSRFLLLTCFFF